MTFYESLYFFICLLFLLLPIMVINLVSYKSSLTRIYTFFLSLLFLYWIIGQDKTQLIFLVLYIFIMLHLVKICVVLRNKYGRNSVIHKHFIIFALLPLAVSKLSGLYDTNIFGFLGISYITFKILQILFEIYDGVIKEVNTFDFLAFVLFFPTFSSGPIDRSRRFEENFKYPYNRNEYGNMIAIGMWKLLLGITYKFVLSSYFYQWMNMYAERYKPWYIILYAYCYGFYMFFDFAGYSLMAVGTSYLLGIKTPDNFNKPFISIDMKDFWNRWHITLSHWFRDFVFSRFILQSIRNKWFQTKLTGAAVGYIVNMVIMGVWHGLTPYYIAYGLYHGILLALTEVYQKKSKFYKKYHTAILYKIISWFVTLNTVMLGFLIFSGRVQDIVRVIISHFI